MNNTNTSPALSTLAPAIAAALPGKWSARPLSPESRVCNFYLTRADGLTLFLAGNDGGWAKPGRLFLQHSRPRNAGKWVELWENHNTVKAPEMTVADTKTAEKIAADIVARLLPESERIDGLALAQIARENSAETARIDTAQAVAAAIGKEDETDRDGKPRTSFYHRGVSLTVNGGESVRVEMHGVTRAQALALLSFMESDAYRAQAGAE